MISVIVPVYNVEKYIRACLDSIINQTYRDLEIILVDDGSTDNSGVICDEYAQKDTRIQVIHKENGGLSSARNAGLEKANGAYVGFVDSDDIIETEMYEKLLETIQMTKTNVCMCGCKMMDEQGKILSEDSFSKKIYDIDEIFQEVVLPLKTSAWNKLYSRVCIGENRFPQGKIHGEDLIFLLEVLTPQTQFSAIEQSCYHYIKHSNSITTKKFSSKSLDEIYCKDEAYKLVEKKFSKYKEQAGVWRFRARMNIMRSIYKAKVEMEYKNEIQACEQYVDSHYAKIKNELRIKERIEAILYKYFKWIYKVFARYY